MEELRDRLTCAEELWSPAEDVGQAADIEIQAKEILFVKSLLNRSGSARFCDCFQLMIFILSYMADATGQPLDKIEEGSPTFPSTESA